MDYISTGFAKFAQDLRFEDLGDDVIPQAKKTILDLIEVALAGYRMEFPTIVVEYFSRFEGET